MAKSYIKRSPGGCPLTAQQWRRLDIIEAIDGIPAQESIDRAGQIKLVGHRTSVWVAEYEKRWKAEFGKRVETDPVTKKLVDLAW